MISEQLKADWPIAEDGVVTRLVDEPLGVEEPEWWGKLIEQWDKVGS